MMRQWLCLGIVFGLLFAISLGQTVKNETTCLTSGNKKVPCTCGAGEIIHIVSKLYQNASADCRPIPGGCQLLQEDLSDGLLPDCNGEQTCDEGVSDFKMKKKCGNITAVFVTVAYECISDKPTNICDITTLMTNTLYLTTPGYPDNEYLIMTETCVCDARGTNMSVEILEIRFSPDINKANLTLTGDFSPWTSTTPFVYNTVAVTRANNLSVVFDSRGRKGNILWINIKSTSNITLICNTETTTTVVTSTATTITNVPTVTSMSIKDSSTIKASTSSSMKLSSVTSVSTSSTSLDANARTKDPKDPGDTTIVGTAVGCAFGVAIVAVVVVAVICLYLRRKRSKSYMNPHDKLQDDTSDEAYKHPMKYIEEYEMSLAAQDSLDSKPLDICNGPPSPEYAELETLGITQTDSWGDSKSGGGENAGNEQSPVRSSIPYTTKRLEELFAKVIPKKFRSTRDMREAEKRARANGTNNNRKPDSGIRNDAYEDVGEDAKDKDNSRTKHRKSRSKSDPDYQEVGGSAMSNRDTEKFPPVPPKTAGIREDAELVMEEAREFHESKTSSKDNLHKNNQQSASPDPNSKSELNELAAQSGDYYNAKQNDSYGDEKGVSNEVSNDDLIMVDNILYEKSDGNQVSDKGENDDLVMVDNVLYEGGSPDQINRDSDTDSAKEKQTPSQSHYEDIKDIALPSPSHVSGDVSPGRPSPYEEIII